MDTESAGDGSAFGTEEAGKALICRGGFKAEEGPYFDPNDRLFVSIPALARPVCSLSESTDKSALIDSSLPELCTLRFGEVQCRVFGESSVQLSSKPSECRGGEQANVSKYANCSGGMIARPMPEAAGAFDERDPEIEIDMDDDDKGRSLSESELSTLGINGSRLVRRPTRYSSLWGV